MTLKSTVGVNALLYCLKCLNIRIGLFIVNTVSNFNLVVITGKET